jgi:hypothetical protein
LLALRIDIRCDFMRHLAGVAAQGDPAVESS